MMLKIFLKKGKGSISVFVTLIMVPVVFFTGFLVDLSRIKFCGNQAVMSADNYGEAILTDYDNLLKELYGLFALTQNKKGTDALDRLDSYVKEYYLTSFKPNDNRISFGYLNDFTATKPYEGWIPYQNAVVTLEAVPVEGASLSEPEIFNTQIGDFMKFRIVQTLGDDADSFMKAIEEVQNMNNNIKAVDKRNEITDKATEVLEAAQDYYVRLEALWQYPEYINKIDAAYNSGKVSMEAAIQGDYAYYKAYKDEEQAIEDAVEHRRQIEEREAEQEAEEEDSGEDGETEKDEETEEDTLSEEEERLCQIDDDYTEHLGHSPQPLKSVFDAAWADLTVRIGWEEVLKTEYGSGYTVKDHKGKTDKTVNFDNFDQKVSELQDAASKLQKKMSDLEQLRSELDVVLNQENITKELKKGMEDELMQLDQLFRGENGYYTADRYVELASHIASYSGQNSDYAEQAVRMQDSMRARGNECIASHPEVSDLPEYEDELNQGKLSAFRGGSSYEKIYETLKECFGKEASDSMKKEAEKKQDAADGLLNKVGDSLDEDDTPSGVRDIPSGGDFAGMGDSGTAGGFKITDMMGSAAKSFGSNSLADTGNRLLTKIYLIQYDFGMFTSRVTNVEESDDGDSVQTSLTGYPMAPNINYLYQAEIEYLLGGHNSSKENLNGARNKILSFRAVMNLASTYTVGPINTAIEDISMAFAAVPVIGPVLKVTVAAALRMAVAGVETYADWELLKKGESVCVLKTEMGDLSVTALPGEFAQGLNNLLGESVSTGGKKSGKFELNYEQYLTIMLIFLTRSEVLTQRTSDLITLNVNTVKQHKGSSGQLSSLTFKMADTVTAVDVTCAVQLDMVVMPKGFAKRTVDAETYTAIEQFENNTYKFTVTRGY